MQANVSQPSPGRRRLAPAALLAAALAALSAQVAWSQEVALSVGQYDALRGSSPGQQIGLAYRPEISVAGFRAEAGAMFATAGAGYAHVAIFREFRVLDFFVLRPSVGAGFYRNTGAKDLGYPVEFRSGIELSVPLKGGRVGVEIFHLSNAHLASHNPGEESVVVAYTVSVDSLLSRGARRPGNRFARGSSSPSSDSEIAQLRGPLDVPVATATLRSPVEVGPGH